MTVDLVPLRYVATVNDDRLDESTDPAYEFDYIDIGSVGLGHLTEVPEHLNFEQSPSRARRLVRQGDTIISTVRTYLRAVWPVVGQPKELVVSTGFAVVRPRSVEPRFLGWAVQADGFIDAVVAQSVGVSYPAINPGDLASLPIPVPPAPVQRRIADFLDAETSRIDDLIAAKQQMINLVTERLRILARTATTVGPRTPLRRVVAAVKTGATPPASELPRLEGEDIPWYAPGDFGPELELVRPSRRLAIDAVDGGWVPVFPSDSTLIVGIGATAGSVAHLAQRATGNQQLTCISTSTAVSGRFMSWQLWSRGPEIRGAAPFTTLPILNNDFLKSFEVFIPPLARQGAVTAALDRAAQQSNGLATALTRQVELLRERRQALITAAVSGELDVP